MPDLPTGDTVATGALQEMLARYRGGSGEEADLRLPPHPYPGLRHFREGEQGFFCGRDPQIKDLAARLATRQALFVLGGSGSGKSSLLQAGLLPRFRGTGPLPGRHGAWHWALCRPETRALDRLADALVRDVLAPLREQEAARAPLERRLGLDGPEAPLAPARLLDWLAPREAGDWGLARIRAAIAEIEEEAEPGLVADAPNLLVVIDQFEEIFRPEADPDQRRRLMALIGQVYRERPDGVYLILAMRSEDTHRCAEEGMLADMLNDSPYYVRWLGTGELLSAIVEPARRVFRDWGLPLEPGSPFAPFEADLVSLLLTETERLKAGLAHKGDHLPLLQHALQTVWDGAVARWEAVPGTAAPRLSLNDLGTPEERRPAAAQAGQGFEEGCGTALEACLSREAHRALDAAERAYGAAAPGPAATALRAAFCEMASLDENQRYHRTFRSAAQIVAHRLEEPAPEAQVRALVAALDSMVARGYLSRGASGVYDVSHEALLRNWAECRRWIEEDLDKARLLLDAAEEGRGPLGPILLQRLGPLLAGGDPVFTDRWLLAVLEGIGSRRTPAGGSPIEPARVLAAARRRFAEARRARAEAEFARRRQHRQRVWLKVGGVGSLALVLLSLGALYLLGHFAERTRYLEAYALGSAALSERGLSAAGQAAAVAVAEERMTRAGLSSRAYLWARPAVQNVAHSLGLLLPTGLMPADRDETTAALARATYERAMRWILGGVADFLREDQGLPVAALSPEGRCLTRGGDPEGTVWAEVSGFAGWVPGLRWAREDPAGNAGAAQGPGLSLEFVGAPVEARERITVIHRDARFLAGAARICMSRDGRVLAIVRDGSVLPDLYTLAWYRLCLGQAETGRPLCGAEGASRVLEVAQVGRLQFIPALNGLPAAQAQDTPRADVATMDERADADGRRFVLLDFVSTSLTARLRATFFDGLVTPVPVGGGAALRDPELAALSWRSLDFRPEPDRASAIAVHGAEGERPRIMVRQRPYPEHGLTIGRPDLAGWAQSFHVEPSDASVAELLDREPNWNLVGPRLVALAVGGDGRFLYMRDELGDVWRAALQAQRWRDELLRRAERAQPGSDEDFRRIIAVCQAISC